jgi:uncharacterized protein YfeS
MANSIANFLKVILPSKKANEKGASQTSTYNPSSSDQILSMPTYRDHLTDIFSSRTSDDSRTLIKNLMRHDPDMSAATNAFLTVADTPLRYIVRDPTTEQVDPAGQLLMGQIINAMTKRADYSKGFQIKPSISAICEAFRYMILARGGIGTELVINKEFLPTELRQVDMGSVEWFEKLPGQFTPQQSTLNGQKISLDFPNFFVAWFRRDPTDIYTYSPFVSAINTIAARQQVINDLYRIMNLTGFPRMEVEVLEEVVMKSAPPDVKMDPVKTRQFITAAIGQVTSQVNNIRPDQAFVHTDAIQPKIMNEKSSMSINIDSVIKTLDAQNQAGLRTMATVIGRGDSGVNTATVEARVFSLNAAAINKPIADVLSAAFTLALRLNGSQSYVEFTFDDVELRPTTELEPNLSMRATRLKTDLSLGIITDEEYHLKMYNRLPPTGAPKLSGTNFLNPATGTSADSSTKTTDKNSNPNDRAAQTKEKAAPARDNKTGANKVS